MLRIVIHCVLFAIFGLAASRAGVDVFTKEGITVWIVLLVIGLVDASFEVRAVRKAYLDGAKKGAELMYAQGWRKP